MAELAILVRFSVRAGEMAAFMAAVRENAAASVRQETGCHRFDILTDPAQGGDEVQLYEIYDDAAAFDLHLQSPHFAVFQETVKGMVTGTTIQRLVLLENAKPL